MHALIVSTAMDTRLRRLCQVVLACCTLCGCAVGPDFTRPDAPAVTAYRADAMVDQSDALTAQHLINGADLPHDWWHLFESAELNDLVQDALAHNATLEAARANLQQSQHNLQAGYGLFFPQLGLGMAASRERTAPIEQGLHTPSSVFNVVTLSAGISYDLDLFGGNRRVLEGLVAQADYQRFASRAAYVTLSANVVNTVVARAAYLAQLQATEQLIGLQQQQLAAIQAQVKAGTAPYTAALSVRSLISSAEAARAALKQQISQTQNLLSSLQGKFPAEASAPSPDFDQLRLPAELPLSLPSELVRQRPDILQSEAQLHASSANIGVATAAMYPHITLSGSVGQAGTSLANLPDASGRFWSGGPAVSLPVFEGGTLWYQRAAAQDAFQVAQANYRQTVLTAFAQVATILEALAHDEQVWQAQSDALHYADEALQSATAGFHSGLGSYLDVLTADIQYHQASIATVQAKAQRYQDTVALFAALGGGWWNDTGKTEQQP